MRGYKRSRGENTWQLIVTVPKPGGGSRQVSRTFHGGSRAADSALRALVREVEAGRHSGTDGTLEELIREWLQVAGYEQSTLALATRDLEGYIAPAIGQRQVRTLKPKDLTLFYAGLTGKNGQPLAASTVRRVHALIRRAIGYGIDLEWVTINPAANARLPKVEDREERQPPSPAELAKLFKAAEWDPAWHAFLRLSASTGARRSELCALRWGRVDLEAGTVTIARSIGQAARKSYEKGTKTRQNRTVLLGPTTSEVLGEHRGRAEELAVRAGVPFDTAGFVFSNDPEGKFYWEPKTVTNRFIRTRQAAGLRPFRLHDLRHFVGSYLIDAGLPVTAVQAQLGHERGSTTTDIYGHAIDQRLRVTADTIDQLLG